MTSARPQKTSRPTQQIITPLAPDAAAEYNESMDPAVAAG
jgi:hypothetical protein